MPTRVFPIHRDFAAEMATIGRLLTDYGELEFALMHCVSCGRDDFDTVLKCMFRARGETQRIDIADALGRQIYRQFGLGTQFEMAIAAIRYCLKIRNQYSHCHWHAYDERLCFVVLEKIAVTNSTLSGLDDLTFHFLDANLLTDQETYFRYTERCFTYLNYQGRAQTGKIPSNPFPWPKIQKPPRLYIADEG